MTDQEPVSRPDLMLTAIAGGYLRNPVRRKRVTCADCATPVDGYELCFACKSHRSQRGLADRTAFLSYAIAGHESGHLMRGYKARPPVAEHRQVVGLLLWLALERHTTCLEALTGRPVPIGRSFPLSRRSHTSTRSEALSSHGSRGRRSASLLRPP
jgi:hypothetical protein